LVTTYLHNRERWCRMILWIGQQVVYAHINMIPASLVGCENRKVVLSTTPARDVGISHLTCRLSSARCVLSPRNSDGDDRAASPGWGEAAPSKPLIGDLGYKRLTTVATRSRIGNKQRAIMAVSLGACQRLSPDSETPNCNDPMREGFKSPFNQQTKKRLFLNAKPL